MRILHIVGSINPAAGGPTEAIRMIIHYRPPGYEAEVVTLDDPDCPFLKDFPFAVHALGRRKKKAWYSSRLVPWLRANRDRFDGVLVHGLWEFTGLASLLAFRGHKPYMVFTHGMLDPYFKRAHPLKHIKKWLYWIPVQYWVLRAAERVLFTTELERDLARQSFWLWHWDPMVVSYGADPQLPEIQKLIPAFYERCPEFNAGHSDSADANTSRPAQRFLLYLGRIDPKKGCDLLVQAFAAIAGQHPELHLIMAGPDQKGWRKELQATAIAAGVDDRIHWPGMLRGDAKWGAFAACDAFILPSHQENFGIAVAEALSCGRPVLISDQVNIAPEIAADGCGIVEPDTLHGTIRLLTRWLALTPAQREEMAAKARSTFSKRYDMRRNSAFILRMFEQLRPHHPTGPAIPNLPEAH
jgi:glycosyltransferase involved in cell wall biosynthesis